MPIDVRKYDVRVYHLLLRFLPAWLPKVAWGRFDRMMFAMYLFYAKRLRPLIFGTPSERSLEYSWVLRNLRNEGKRILNVGCGDSLFSGELAGRGYECLDIDLNCCPLSTKLPIFLQANIMKAPFQDCSFDQIIAISTLEHIKGDEAVLMKELSRLLRERGLLFVTMPAGDYKGACGVSRIEKLLVAANELNVLRQQYCIAQGRKWQAFSGKEAHEKIHPFLNKTKIIALLVFTKRLNSTNRETE